MGANQSDAQKAELAGAESKVKNDLDAQIQDSPPAKNKMEDDISSPNLKRNTNFSGFAMMPSQSFSKLEKVSEEDWDSPKRPRALNKAKEAENSEDDSEKHSSESDTASLQQAIKSLTSTDKGTDKETKQTDGTMPVTGDKKEEIVEEENVVDMVSFKSRYSKNCFETASVKKSIVSSKMSCKDKKQFGKALKKVQFFSLKADSIVEGNDLDSDGMQEAEDFDLRAMNKSIQRVGLGGMKRNPKSFNFTQKQYNDFLTAQDELLDAEKSPTGKMGL